jgi:hypothetical protein
VQHERVHLVTGPRFGVFAYTYSAFLFGAAKTRLGAVSAAERLYWALQKKVFRHSKERSPFLRVKKSHHFWTSLLSTGFVPGF